MVHVKADGIDTRDMVVIPNRLEPPLASMP